MPYETKDALSVKQLQFQELFAMDDVNTGTLADSDGVTVKCDAYLKVTDDGGNVYYLPLYDTVE